MKISDTVLYTAGDYEVRLVEVNDTRIPSYVANVPGTGQAYGIIHKPTGVLNGTTQMYYIAIRGAWTLNKELEEALADPGDEQGTKAPSGFGMPGFG